MTILVGRGPMTFVTICGIIVDEKLLTDLGVTILVGRGPTTFVTICGIIVDMLLLTRFRSDDTSR